MWMGIVLSASRRLLPLRGGARVVPSSSGAGVPLPSRPWQAMQVWANISLPFMKLWAYFASRCLGLSLSALAISSFSFQIFAIAGRASFLGLAARAVLIS